MCHEMTIYQGIGRVCYILVCECGWSSHEWNQIDEVVKEWHSHLEEGILTLGSGSDD